MFPNIFRNLKLIILLYYVHTTLARYNDFGVHFVQPRLTYYDYEESPLPQYDDEVCRKDLGGNLFVDYRRCVLPYFSNNEVLLTAVSPTFCNIGAGGAQPVYFGVDIRQTFEVEPPNLCPIVEAEIKITPYYTSNKLCYLVWDQHDKYTVIIGDNKYISDDRVIIQTKCWESEDPDGADNPKRIFTFVPYTLTEYDGKSTVKYKLCAFKNTSCDLPSIALSRFHGLAELNFYLKT